jgi:hypothetical protein
MKQTIKITALVKHASALANRRGCKLAVTLLAGLVLSTASLRAQAGGPASDLVFFGGQVVINAPEATNVSEFFPAFAPAPPIPNIAVVLYEDATQSVVSDQIWIQNGFFYFASDPDLVNLQTLNIPVIGALVEDGTPQDVSQFFTLPAGTLLVQSDVEPTPEPGTVSLALLGCGILLVLKRRMRN